MKHFYLLITLMLFKVHAQDYTIDGSNIVVSKVVENIEGSKDQIYDRVKAYFIRSYGDANSVIQTDDKKEGLIIGKGLYLNMTTFMLGTWTTKAYHILRVDVKEGRARIMCSASTIIPNSSTYPGNDYEYYVTKHYPLTDKRAPNMMKKAQKEAFEKLVDHLNLTVEGLELSLKGEGVLLKEEKQDW